MIQYDSQIGIFFFTYTTTEIIHKRYKVNHFKTIRIYLEMSFKSKMIRRAWYTAVWCHLGLSLYDQ